MPRLVPEDYQLSIAKIPILVQLGLTYRCNLRCRHCYALYRRDRNEFRLDEIRALADELYSAGSAAVVYGHGENMIRKDFQEAAAVFRDLGFHQTLMLNGFYVGGPADAERLADAGIDRAMISIDSASPRVHDKVRGKQRAFRQAMRAVKSLLDSKVGTVGFSCTIDRHNYGTIPEIVELALATQVHAISFMQNRYNTRDMFNRALWWSYQGVCQQIYELMLRYRGHLDIYTHDPFMLTLLDDRLDNEQARADFIGANLCNVGTSMVSIDPVGNVTACNFISEVVGNVRREPFGDIWQRLVERYSIERESASGPCASCWARLKCMGGCKAYHYGVFGIERG